MNTLLAPSILAGDHADLASSAALIEKIGAQWIHLDIMDGHFVPNLTFGPETVAALRRRTRLLLDTHLMLDQPQNYIEPFARAGSNLISIHIEPDYDITQTLARIRSLGCQNGIVINPGTPVTPILPHLPFVDLVLVMTVQPGFGGQAFRSDVLPKIRELAELRRQHHYPWRLEVDGGVDRQTAQLCRTAGADTLVAGSAFFRDSDPVAFRKALEE